MTIDRQVWHRYGRSYRSWLPERGPLIQVRTTTNSPKDAQGPNLENAFRDRFYKDQEHHFTWRDRQRCRFFYEHDDVSLKAVPKKLVPIELSDGVQERFYGLYAIEKIALSRVLVHLFLTTCPGIAFFFLCTFLFNAGWQLSNAAFLYMLILATLALLLNYVYDDMYSAKA